jgi:hypothetical protein
MISQGQVGPQGPLAVGANPNLRVGQLGDLIVTELHGKYYEQVYRGNTYSIGHNAVLALLTTHATATSLTAAAVPILGIYNPSTSTINAVVLQTTLYSFLNNVTSVAPGNFVWAVSTGNTAISTGLTPYNKKTLSAAGSQVKAFAGATALTGLTNNLTILEAADFPIASGLLTTTVAATTPTPSVGATQNFEGGLIVPPGSVLALMCTLSTTTHSVYGRMLWEEVNV